VSSKNSFCRAWYSLARQRSNSSIARAADKRLPRGQQDVRIVADGDDEARDAAGLGGFADVDSQEVARVAAALLELVARDGLAEGWAREALEDELGVALGLAGAGLGVAWSWAVLAFAVTVLLYGLSFGWGAQEPLRHQVAVQLQSSQLTAAVRTTLPALRDLIEPWLPGGLPAPLSA
jgi:hypothetical protein